jgi:putative DNA methylase
MHSAPEAWLRDEVVYDPFMGGGTSLVESARMGAAVAGRNVDPMAVAVVGGELSGPVAGFDAASEALIAS